MYGDIVASLSGIPIRQLGMTGADHVQGSNSMFLFVRWLV
jgi:hypothetical protein